MRCSAPVALQNLHCLAYFATVVQLLLGLVVPASHRFAVADSTKRNMYTLLSMTCRLSKVLGRSCLVDTVCQAENSAGCHQINAKTACAEQRQHHKFMSMSHS